MQTVIRQVCQNRKRATGFNKILQSSLCLSVNKCLWQAIVLRLITTSSLQNTGSSSLCTLDSILSYFISSKIILLRYLLFFFLQSKNPAAKSCDLFPSPTQLYNISTFLRMRHIPRPFSLLDAITIKLLDTGHKHSESSRCVFPFRLCTCTQTQTYCSERGTENP